MSVAKKGLILCDYCGTEKEFNQIYTTRKHFAGLKIIDIIQNVTQRTIPATTSIKVCSLCASTLHAATGAIAKALQMVSKLSPIRKRRDTIAVLSTSMPNADSDVILDTTSGEDDIDEAEVTQVAVQTPTPKERKPKSTPISVKAKVGQTPTSPRKQPNKVKQIEISTPTKQPSKNKQVDISTPTKQDKSIKVQHKSVKDLDESLQDAVKVTPIRDMPKKKNNDFINLFGATVGHITDSEEENDEDDVAEEASKKPNPTTGFECKLCDFKSNYPIPLKKHLKQLHNQQRPRVYNCTKCPKSFGILKTLNAHLLTHDPVSAVEQQQVKPKDVQLAVLTALNPKPKPLENVLNSEYTFAITETNSSTPKPAVEQTVPITYPCEICHMELNTVKAIKEHLQTVHDIAKPRIFKCSACELDFMHKPSLLRHFELKHSAEEQDPKKVDNEQKAASDNAKKSKPAPKRRKTVVIEGDQAADVEPLKKLPKNEGIFSPQKKIDAKVKEALSAQNDKTQSKVEQFFSPKKNKNKTKVEQKPEEELGQEEQAAINEVDNSKQVEEALEHLISDSEINLNEKSTDLNETNILETTTLKPLTNGTPKKLGKIKAEEEPPVKVKSAKKAKHAKLENSEDAEIDIFDQVNAAVKPHKRALLDSITISESELSCTTCGKLVSSRKRLDSHMLKKHTKHLRCPTCYVKYTNSLEYVGHFAACDASAGLPCGIANCGKVFQAANYLSSHLNKRHKIN